MMAPVTPVMSVNWKEPCLAFTVYLVLATVVAPAFTTKDDTFCLAEQIQLVGFGRRRNGAVSHGAGSHDRRAAVERQFEIARDKFFQGAGKLAFLALDDL